MNETGRAQIDFSKMHHEGLYSYLSIVRPYATPLHPMAGLDHELYKYQLHSYLSLAEFLLGGLEKVVIIRASPAITETLTDQPTLRCPWHYEFVANDLNGLGLDRGFVNTDAINGEEQVLVRVNSLYHIDRLTEDSLGDKISHLSIIGLKQNNHGAMDTLVQSRSTPNLSSMLNEGELFINIAVSKQADFFHSLLIKSPLDIDELLNSYLTVIVSDN